VEALNCGTVKFSPVSSLQSPVSSLQSPVSRLSTFDIRQKTVEYSIINSPTPQILQILNPESFRDKFFKTSTPQSRKLSGQIFQIFKSSVKTKNPKRETRNPKLPRKISELCNILMVQCKNSDTKTYHLCIKTNNTKRMPFRRNALNKNFKKNNKVSNNAR